MPRIFYNGELKLGEQIHLDAAASHHLVSVLRLQLGDKFFLFNGQGGEFSAEITALSKRQVQASLQSYCVITNESPLTIHLIQGISRGEKMDFTIQKAVELGVSQITPVFTEYCNVQLTGDRLYKRWQHWRAIAVHAAEQSVRQKIPEVDQPSKLADALVSCNAGLRLLLMPQAALQWRNLTDKPNSIALVIGPEGGLSDKEIELAKTKAFQALRLGPRVLRTETAALAALSCIQMQWGDFI